MTYRQDRGSDGHDRGVLRYDLIWLNATGNLDNKDGVTPLFIAALYEDAAGTQPIVAREQRSGNVSRGAEAPISR